MVILPELSSLQQVPHKTQLNTRPARRCRNSAAAVPARTDDRQKNDRRPGQRPPVPQNRNRPEEEEREEFDRDMDAIEDRADEFDREGDEEPIQKPMDVQAGGGPRRPEPNVPQGRMRKGARSLRSPAANVLLPVTSRTPLRKATVKAGNAVVVAADAGAAAVADQTVHRLVSRRR